MADPLEQMCDELDVSQEEALFYLEGFRWDQNAATDACRSKTLPSPSLAADQPPSKKNERAATVEEPSGDEKIQRFVEATGATVEEARDHLSRNNWNVDDACRSFSKKPVPVSGNEGSGLVQEVLSQVPQTNLGPPWTSTSPFRVVQRSMNLFHDVVSTASVQDVTDCLNYCKGDVDAAILYYHNVCSEREKLMASFSSTTGETRQVAKFYLEQYKWDLDRAINFFLDHGHSEEQTSALNNRDPPLQSSSDPTQKSPEEAGEGDVTVADGKAAAETETDRDSTTVETQTAPSTIVLTIRLAEIPGTTELELPFKSNQTVRDIRNAIDQRYPDKDRGYSLRSMDGVDYMDWSITVYRVSIRGTLLFQVYP